MKKAKNLIIILILACVVFGYIFCLMSENKKAKKIVHNKEYNEIVNRNLDKNYPRTPKDLVGYYSKILKYLYSGNPSSDDVKELAGISRKLFDEELLLNQSRGQYEEDLLSELQKYKEEKRKISSYVVENNSEIEYKTFQSHYYAFVDCAYYIKGEKTTYRTLETYTLRKDSEGKWKLLYWSLTPVQEDGETETTK